MQAKLSLVQVSVGVRSLCHFIVRNLIDL